MCCVGNVHVSTGRLRHLPSNIMPCVAAICDQHQNDTDWSRPRVSSQSIAIEVWRIIRGEAKLPTTSLQTAAHQLSPPYRSEIPEMMVDWERMEDGLGSMVGSTPPVPLLPPCNYAAEGRGPLCGLVSNSGCCLL